MFGFTFTLWRTAINVLGGPGAAPDLPTAPVLAITSASSDDTPEFTIDIDDTVEAGDDIRLQIAAAGTSFAAPVSDTTHDITAPEDVANDIDLALASLANGDYEARCSVSDGVLTSNWSNTVSFTIAASSDPVDYIELEAGSGYIELEAGGGYIQQEAA
ncbi:MAG: hypothetical protein WC670_18895 [Pseudolabrys sp.]|jgi:hypothetical protein